VRRLREAIAGAVRVLEALKPAIGALDLAGLSWRQLRGFQRGAACLADCREGHTYGPWCQLGWPIPGPSWLITELADATMPLPTGAKRLDDEVVRAIHASLTQVGTSWLEALEQVGPTEGPVPTPAVDTESAELNRLAEHLASHPAVESVQLIHHPACASLPDVEGKAGPCDCQGWSDVVQEEP